MLSNFCGFRLNTAGVVIGWVGAVWSLLVVVFSSVGLAYLDELSKLIADNIKEANLDQETIKYSLLIIFCIAIVINTINLAASALLITGTVKERHLLLVPWLLNSGLSLLSSGAYTIRMLIEAISQGVPVGSIVFFVILSGLSLVFQFYIWYAIYSLYKQIQANRDVQQRLIPATSSSYPSYTKI